MATRVNRAATAATKQGGRSARKGARNKTTALWDRHRSLEKPENRKAFQAARHESLARHRNATMGVPTREEALGVPESADFTLRHRMRSRILAEHSSSRFLIWSNAFGHHERIPKQYTHDGDNCSPPISWHCVSETAQEFVLVCEDLSLVDRPPLVHWLIYRIPGSVEQLPEGIPQQECVRLVQGVPLQGLNDFGGIGYSGPFPPLYDGWHQYRFRLFALDRNLQGLVPRMTLDEVYERMKGHVLNQTEFMGRYRRTRGTLERVPGAD